MNAAAFLVFTLAFASSAWGNPWTGKDALQYEWNPTINIFPKAIDSLELHRSEFKLFKYQDFNVRSVGRHAINRKDLSSKGSRGGSAYRTIIYNASNYLPYTYKEAAVPDLVLQYAGVHKIRGCDFVPSGCRSLEYDPLILGTLIPQDLANKKIKMKFIGASYDSASRSIKDSISGWSAEIQMAVDCRRAKDSGTMVSCSGTSPGDLTGYDYSVPDEDEDYKRTAILIFRLKGLRHLGIPVSHSNYPMGNKYVYFNLIFQV